MYRFSLVVSSGRPSGAGTFAALASFELFASADVKRRKGRKGRRKRKKKERKGRRKGVNFTCEGASVTVDRWQVTGASVTGDR